MVAFFLVAGQLHSQAFPQFSESASSARQMPAAVASLPKRVEEIDGAIARIEKRLDEVRLKLAAPKTTDRAATAALATPDELTERDQLFQQWLTVREPHTFDARIQPLSLRTPSRFIFETRVVGLIRNSAAAPSVP